MIENSETQEWDQTGATVFTVLLEAVQALPEQQRGPNCLYFAGRLIEMAAFDLARGQTGTGVTDLLLLVNQLDVRAAAHMIPTKT